jgi:hypothetical protein
VMEIGLAKNPNIRTKTVGELATAVGHAYGLEGDHKMWAMASQSELARMIAEARSRAPEVKPQALEAAADPFAAPAGAVAAAMGGTPGMGPTGTHGMAQSPPAAPSSSAVAHYPAPSADELPMGLPGVSGQRPAWLIPLAVGIAALVVGGGIMIALVR